ncbi:MAG: DUF2092 domain-containing protein [Methanoregulaceae archaeon]|nr:DUF2092 domain-containing protein [Methanoregulaceae archaeon]
MALAALLFCAISTPDEVLARMATYLQKPFSVSMQVTRDRFPGTGAGSLTVQRPNRMHYRLNWMGDSYEIGWSENRTIEFVHNLKTYFESGPYPRLYQPESHLTDVPKFGFPLFLLAADLKSIYPGVPLKLIGKETVGGESCDHVRGGTIGGFDVWVASDGRPMRFRYDDQDPVGKVSVKYEFAKWSSAASTPMSFFEPVAPAGFRPHALPRDPYPIQPGNMFPVEGWVSAKGPAANLKFTKPTLLVVTAPDCEASGRAAGALRELSREAAIWVFSDSGRVPPALAQFPAYRDRNGRTMARFFAPGTPLILLIRADGKVVKTWLGFSKGQSEKFVAEIRAAIQDR